jgi:putative NADH-flavin reductase
MVSVLYRFEEAAMHTVIFGANGPTGRRLVAEAMAKNFEVTAAVRNSARFDVAGVRVKEVDVLDAASVSAVVADADAVLSSLGVPFSRAPIETYSRGTRNIVAAMAEQGVRRLLVTSSSAADPEVRFKNSGGGPLLEAMKPLVIFAFGRSTYRDMRLMETIVRDSGLDWTIVRPSGLFDGEQVTDYRIADGHIRGAFTSRRDLAHFMVTQVDSTEWVGRVAAIATSDGTPNPIAFFKAEAMK